MPLVRNQFVNPYVERIREFQGKIFLFEDFATDLQSVSEIIKDRSAIAEIGSGSGGHLIEMAKRNPDKLCFGLEIRYKRSVRTIEKAIKDEVSNLYLLRYRGEEIANLFPEKSLARIDINFPDPWPKVRHHKHRLFSPEFLTAISSILTPGGLLSFKTDHQEYFDWASKMISTTESGLTLKAQTRDLHQSDYQSENIITEFEKMFILKGLPIYMLQLVKI